MFSTPGRSHDKTDDNSPLHTYATVDTSRIKSSWNSECEKIGKFSAKTDVWSFGVTMWEIFVLAKYEPYYKMNDADLVENALTGSERLILSCPERCPRSMYEIMRGCWAHNASERLTFKQLQEKLLYLL